MTSPVNDCELLRSELYEFRPFIMLFLYSISRKKVSRGQIYQLELFSCKTRLFWKDTQNVNVAR